VVSVNVGRPRTVEWRGRPVTTAIWKTPATGPVAVAGVNIHGDDQADRRVHGGPDKAVYAYAVEDYHWWSDTLGRPLEPGTFGENLTTAGIDFDLGAIGDRWHIADVVLEVAQPRQPCYKLGIRMGDDSFVARFATAGRPGVYLRVVEAGTVHAGDPIHVEPAAPPHIPVTALARPDPTHHILTLAAGDHRVPEGWRRAAARALQRDTAPGPAR
jgi:MOSC domain-containing protein YiiM